MSGQVPAWLADWLGLPVSAGGDATWQFDSAWTWAAWATLLLVVFAVAWTVGLYVREPSAAGRCYRGLLAALRLLAVASLLVMIAQLALVIRLNGPPPIVLVIDRSASMNIADQQNDPALVARLREELRANGFDAGTRLDVAKLLLTQNKARFLDQLSQRFRLNVYIAADNVARLPRAADVGEISQSIRA